MEGLLTVPEFLSLMIYMEGCMLTGLRLTVFPRWAEAQGGRALPTSPLPRVFHCFTQGKNSAEGALGNFLYILGCCFVQMGGLAEVRTISAGRHQPWRAFGAFPGPFLVSHQLNFCLRLRNSAGGCPSSSLMPGL